LAGCFEFRHRWRQPTHRDRPRETQAVFWPCSAKKSPYCGGNGAGLGLGRGRARGSPVRRARHVEAAPRPLPRGAVMTPSCTAGLVGYSHFAIVGARLRHRWRRHAHGRFSPARTRALSEVIGARSGAATRNTAAVARPWPRPIEARRAERRRFYQQTSDPLGCSHVEPPPIGLLGHEREDLEAVRDVQHGTSAAASSASESLRVSS